MKLKNDPLAQLTAGAILELYRVGISEPTDAQIDDALREAGATLILVPDVLTQYVQISTSDSAKIAARDFIRAGLADYAARQIQ